MTVLEAIVLVYLVGFIGWMFYLLKVGLDHKDQIVEDVEDETGEHVENPAPLMFLSIFLLALAWPYTMAKMISSSRSQ